VGDAIMSTFETRLHDSITTKLTTFKNEITSSDDVEIRLLEDYIDIYLQFEPLHLKQLGNESNSSITGSENLLFKQIMALECIKSQCEILSLKNTLKSIIDPLIIWIKSKLSTLWSLLMTLITPKGWSISGSIGIIGPFSSSTTLKIDFGK
jgi:hypothetical protein